jgi:hypothetical protein
VWQDLFWGYYGDGARYLKGFIHMDPRDIGVGVKAANEGRVAHSRQLDVV